MGQRGGSYRPSAVLWSGEVQSRGFGRNYLSDIPIPAEILEYASVFVLINVA